MKYRVVTDKDKLVAIIPVDKVAKLRRVYAQLKERVAPRLTATE